MQSIILAVIIAIVFSISLGFSIFDEKLNIAGTAILRAQKDVRITGLSVTNLENEAITNYYEYNTDNVTIGFTLPNQNSTITYKVEVTNFGNIEAAIKNISGLPSSLEIKSISGYTLEDSICDNNECTLGITKDILVTIGYKEGAFDSLNTLFNTQIDFDFRSVYSITYQNIINHDYPSRILEGDSLTITFVTDIPDTVSVSGVKSHGYISPVLTISNPTQNVIASNVISSRHYDQLVFDGTNYVDTGIALFSEDNIDKNFEISFELADIGSNQISQATIINSMQEVSPYPGFVFRLQTNTTLMEFNSPKINNKTGINVTTTNKILIKRINDIYYIQINDGTVQTIGTYSGAKFNETTVLGAYIDGSGNPQRYFKGTLENVDIVVYEPEKYTVKFDANGGTGTMADQIIRKDDNVSLSQNTFEKDIYMFDSWNTKADGTGTAYNDMQSVLNIADANETITLYAQWISPITYYVKFNPNGGTGTIANQEFEYNVAQSLSTNTFTKANRTFVKWNTEPDGSGIDYRNGQSVKNLTKTENEIINLYAVWAEEYYSNTNESVFDGSNYIDTGLYLFNQANINKNFEVSFEIVSRTSSGNQATIMSCMDESGSPWPGIVYRVVSGTQDELAANVTASIKASTRYNRSELNKVTIKRKNGILYLSQNDGKDELVLDMSSLTNTFDSPVAFGASLKADGTPKRYFKGILKNMTVSIME